MWKQFKNWPFEPFYPPFKIFEWKIGWMVSSGPLDGRVWDVEGEKLQMLVISWGRAFAEEVCLSYSLGKKCAYLRGLSWKDRQIVIICDVFDTWESFYGCLMLEKVEFGCTHFAWLRAATAVLLKNGAKSEFALILGQKWVKNKSTFLKEC